MYFIVQAASINWSGSPDYCMSEYKGKTAFERTIENIRKYYQNQIYVCAPEYDKKGSIEKILSLMNLKDVSAIFLYDESPLHRFLYVIKNLPDDDYFVRVDGLNFWINYEDINHHIEIAKRRKISMLKFPDDHPAQLTYEIYNVGDFKKISSEILKLEKHLKDMFCIYPKYYYYISENFKFDFISSKNINIDFLNQCRLMASSIYNVRRIDVSNNNIKAADQISFHYELARKYIGNSDIVLDCASGNGFGGSILSDFCKEIICGDIDDEAINDGLLKYSYIKNLKFIKLNAIDTKYENDFFDVIVSFETIEHLDPNLLLSEFKRILKPGGLLILSTPQNSHGFIPICAEHIREFSYIDLKNLISDFFEIQEFIGIKSGRIYFDNDPIGSNSFVVAKNI